MTFNIMGSFLTWYYVNVTLLVPALFALGSWLAFRFRWKIEK